MMQKKQRQRTLNMLVWGALGLAAVAVLGYAIWAATRPVGGEVVAIMADTGHVQEGTDPGPYNSDPPTSGRHYASELDAGFYTEEDLARYEPHPEGYLVHNLEHGYIIFWYNCDRLSESGCQALKDQIRGVLDQENNLKVIAFPRPALDVPVVLTSWGKLMRFDDFDPAQARLFVQRNRNKAPEPNAP
jgi:hypothetical protein